MSTPDDTFRPYATYNMLYDSNFLRVSDSVDPLVATGKSDLSEIVNQLSAGIDIDWAFKRQHFIIKANINQNWFQNFTSLDYLGWDTRAQWNWQLGNNLNGEIGYTNIQKLGSFEYLNALIPNLQNYQNYFASAGYLFHPSGKIKVDVYRVEMKYEDGDRKFNNNTENNVELNLQYLSPTGSILGLQIIGTDGSYPDRGFELIQLLDDGYTRMQYALTWEWYASVKTSIDGLIGYVDQNYDNLSDRDFADVIAELNLRWYARDDTYLELSLRRYIYQADDLVSSFLLSQGVWFNFTWKVTPKITLALPISYENQQFQGDVSISNVNLEQEEDNVVKAGLNLKYYPWNNNFNIGAMFNYEKRDSNFQFRVYDSISAGLTLNVVF